jgi:hypothetical protein
MILCSGPNCQTTAGCQCQSPLNRERALLDRIASQQEHIRKQAEDIMTLGNLVYATESETWKDRAASLEADIAELRAGSVRFAVANAALGARVTELEAALVETLAIATRNEDGEFAARARAALSSSKQKDGTE